MAYIYAVTRDRDVAEEIFQELGVVIADHAGRGTEVERFTGWAVGIARRQIAAWYRANERHRQTVPISEQVADALALAVEENQSLLDQEQTRFSFLQECVEELTGRSREVIHQRYREGKSNSAIAAELDSVKVALSRARRTLAECVERKLRIGEEG
jgi:RNA polymerase sigma factor (sigma-70 family)